MSRQFLKHYLDLLDNPYYLEFMQTPANLVYLLIQKRVFRKNWQYPQRTAHHELLPFFEEGWLVARVTAREIHDQLAATMARIEKRPPSQSAIATYIADLDDMGLLDRYPWPGGGTPLLQLGFWRWLEPPGGGKPRYTEVSYSDKVFETGYYPEWETDGAELSPFQNPERG